MLHVRSLSIIGLSSLFLSACSDPNRPAEFIDVPTPDWTQDIEDIQVSKRYCAIQFNGEVFRITYADTDIGDGLTATRDRYDCYVTDQKGVQCNWNTGEQIQWCRVPNPAYAEYLASNP